MMLYRGLRLLAGRAIRAVPWLRRQWLTSTDYRQISNAEAHVAAASGWMSPLTVRRQAQAYEKLLREMYAGSPRVDLRLAAEAVDAVGLPAASLLEVGCGSGYYREVFARLSKTKVDYSGIDYSPAMIRRARARYPGVAFEVGDATHMTHGSNAFDIVFNGVSLMHILDYRAAITDSVRVARKACIFHSVPVFLDHPTIYIHKYAYGSPVTEMVFSRDELQQCFLQAGLSIARSWRSIPYDVSALVQVPSHSETFLCLKGGA